MSGTVTDNKNFFFMKLACSQGQEMKTENHVIARISVENNLGFDKVLNKMTRVETAPKKLGRGVLMATGCNPVQKAKWQITYRMDLAGYISNKSCKHEHVMMSPQLSHYSFSFLYKLLHFFFYLIFLHISRFTDN